MFTFKRFIEQSEEDKDILNTLSKIPSSHSALVKGFTFKFQSGNTLNGDDDHIGYVQNDPKVIVIASPWNYGREFTLLHEVGHRVYEKLPKQIHKAWEKLVSKTPNSTGLTETEPEELFCMSYAQFYAKNKMLKYNYPEWLMFIKKVSRFPLETSEQGAK